MALPPLVSLEEFETWLGRNAVPPQRAEAIIAAASTLVRIHSGRTWVGADGEPDSGVSEIQLDAARTVVQSVAQRVWVNPNGITQETTGPFSRSVAAWAALGMSLSPEEQEMLGSGVTGLSSVRLLAPAEARATVSGTVPWWEDEDDDE